MEIVRYGVAEDYTLISVSVTNADSAGMCVRLCTKTN